MSENSNSFRSAEEQVTRSFDDALTDARAKVDQATTKAFGKLKV
jgi:hypothetical protein